MNLNFSEEQVMLKETIQKFCDNDYDFYKREEVIKSENDFDLNTWNLFAEQDGSQCHFLKIQVVLEWDQ